MSIRTRIISSIEGSMESFPEGGHETIDLDEHEFPLDRSVQWSSSPEKLLVSLTVSREGTVCYRDEQLVSIEPQATAGHYKLAYGQNAFRYSGTRQSKRPKRFEGLSSELSLWKLGRVAWTLSRAAKITQDPEAQHRTVV